jgi:hypothetical protein
MTTNAQRLSDLEQQVADLAARIEEVARKGAALRTLEQAWFEVSGWTPAQRPALKPSRPRHLQVVPGGAR